MDRDKLLAALKASRDLGHGGHEVPVRPCPKAGLISVVVLVTLVAVGLLLPREGASRASLETLQMSSGVDPVLMVTLQTKGMSLLGRMGGPWKKIYNIGLGKPWHGFKTKFELLEPFLAGRNDTELVAFVDGSDIFWGGCSMDYFVKKYHEIVRQSGKPIVVSAEVACGEQLCSLIPDVPKWAEKMARKPLSSGWWSKYVAPDGCKSVCKCADPPVLKYLNSGFIMGTVRALKHLVTWSKYNYDRVSTLGDQSVIAQYWLEHRDMISLDYTGELCLTASDLDLNKIFWKSTKTGHVWNRAFGHAQCLIHGNGRSRGEMWDMIKYYSKSPHGRKYREAASAAQKSRRLSNAAMPP